MASDDWFTRLKQEIADDGRSDRTISLAAGLGQNYVQQMLAKNQPPKPGTLDKLLSILPADAAARVRNELAGMPSEVRPAEGVPFPMGGTRDLPVLGSVAGSDYKSGGFQLTSGPIDYVRRPPGLIATRDVYALYVEGSSMSPRFEPGELIFVHPNRPSGPGDYVVIQEPTEDEGMRGFVKQFVKRTSEWIVVRQLNPEGTLRFRNVASVKVHRILTSAEMMGV